MISARTLLLVSSLAIVSVAAAPTIAGAQLRSTRVVAAEGAQRAIVAAVAEAKKQGWNVSIAVVDNAGDLVGFYRMDAAPVASADISVAKARTSARLRRATRGLDSTLSAGRYAILSLPGVTSVEGGVPIIVNGETVGAIGVSGASSAQDAQVASIGAAEVQP